VDILKSMAKDPNALKPAFKESTLQSTDAPDISKIKVSTDFVSKVTGGRQQVKKSRVNESSQNKLVNLIEQLSGLVGEARTLLEEMTSVGNIGTAPVGKPKNRKKLLLNKIKINLRR